MNARAYYLLLQKVVHAAPHVIRSDMRFQEIDVNECYVSGVLLLTGDYELHIAEYVVTTPVLVRPKYRYHLQAADGTLVSRWDNAPHHREIATHPDHRHDGSAAVHAASPMSIAEVLDAVLPLIMPS